MKENTKYWLELADYDIDTALAMLNTKRYLYVGFMCHQSIEKAIKSIMCEHSEEIPPKIHNLIRLAELGGIFELLDDKQKKLLFTLNPLNIESRYPSYKDNLLSQLTDARCHEILNNTKELLSWIKSQL